MQLDHQKLQVYQRALELVALADGVARAFPRGRAYLADQLRRAATSIVLNIAEGAGEFAPADKARFYRMAKRSAVECTAVFDVVERLALVDAERMSQARAAAVEVIAMLTRMALNRRTRAARGSEGGQGGGGMAEGGGARG
ncbi:MAG: four helix bundle protein [Myxococcales bacterium]|nr:four helix bundle protein [Myxococcales bacterium]